MIPLMSARAGRAVTSTAVFNPATDRPFTDASPWNTPIDHGSTTWYDHDRLHTWLNGGSNPVWWFFGETTSGDPPVSGGPLRIWYTNSADPVWSFIMPDYIYAQSNRNRPAETFNFHGPADMLDSYTLIGDSDAVLVVVDTDTGDYVEVWNTDMDPGALTVRSSNPALNSALPGWAKGNIITGPGAGTLGGLNDGVRASNFCWSAGCINGRDIANGYFDHALQVSLPGQMLTGIVGGETNFEAPATSIDFNAGAAGPLPMGSRLGIPSTTSEPAGFTAWESAMFDCLQTYGAFVGDFVGSVSPVVSVDINTVTAAQVDPFRNWNRTPGLWDDLSPLIRVTNNNFYSP